MRYLWVHVKRVSALLCALLSMITLSLVLSLSLNDGLTHAQERWRVNASEAEATSIIRDLLKRAEMPSGKLKRGAYPLLGADERSVIPLVSTPCPLLLSCDELVGQLKVALLNRGYRLIYSDQSPRPNGPLHFAIARGKRPVLALRLNPAHSSITAVLHIDESLIAHQATLRALPEHITLSLSSEVIMSAPLLLNRLVEQNRELLVRIDEVMIKRALLDPESGALIQESARRRDQLRRELDRLFKQVPSLVGVYLDQRALEALDRALSDELVERCAQQHRIVVTPSHDDDTLRSISRTLGVRSFELSSSLNDQNGRVSALSERLKALEATLVLTGEITLDLDLSTPINLRDFSQWIYQVKQRQVHLFRVSERAW